MIRLLSDPDHELPGCQERLSTEDTEDAEGTEKINKRGFCDLCVLCVLCAQSLLFLAFLAAWRFKLLPYMPARKWAS